MKVNKGNETMIIGEVVKFKFDLWFKRYTMLGTVVEIDEEYNRLTVANDNGEFSISIEDVISEGSYECCSHS